MRVEAQLASRFARVVRIDPPEVTLVGRLGSLRGVQTVKTVPINPPENEATGVVATLALPAGVRLADGTEGTVVVALETLK